LNILAITTMRNEGPHCLEWFAHHLAIGVDQFLVYSNDCDDGTDSILDLLEMSGIVTHECLKKSGQRPVQWQALKHATDHQLYGRADWVLVADCDEFINLRAPLADLPALIALLPDTTDAMAMRWRLFGNSGHMDMQDVLTTERFVMAAPTDINLPLAHFFKALFRPGTFRQIGVHRPRRNKDRVPVWVDGSGVQFSEGFGKSDKRINLFGQPAGTDLVQLNHYSLRSAADFMIKRARGLPNHVDREIGLGYWVERNFNTVEDTSIHHMLAGTRAKLAELMEIPGMAELHEKSFQIHRQKFEQAMSIREEIQLFWHLGLCNSSQPPSSALARSQVNRIAKLDPD